MLRLKWTSLPLLLALMIPLSGVKAQAPGPKGIVAPPAELAASVASQPEALETSANVQIAGLKAILIAGPIDGDDGSWTQQEIDSLEMAADQLEAYGVQVHRFYTPINDWDAIRAAAVGAQFLMYRGHGLRWGSQSTSPVGGFDLKDGAHSPEEIRAELALHPNAIVMLYGCYTAGSSSDETQAIDSEEARRRVGEYSDPFFDRGAAGYYANWFGDAFTRYIQFLFSGKTLRQAYESYFDFNPGTVERYSHPSQPDQVLYLDKDNWDGIVYNNAFAGRPDETLESLFSQPVSTKQLNLEPRIFLPAVIN